MAKSAQNGPKWPKMAQIAPFGPLWPVCAHIQGSTRHVLSQSELPRSPKSLDFPCFRGKSNGFTGPDRPRGAQECPIHALWIRGREPKGPKGAQRDPKGPKRAQKGPKPQNGPKWPKTPKKCHFRGFWPKWPKTTDLQRGSGQNERIWHPPGTPQGCQNPPKWPKTPSERSI